MDAVFEQWSQFNVAVAGAGAALGGLLIVALSVNIRQIAESRGLAARAAGSITAIILGVALCCAALIPGQVVWGYGIQVLAGAAAAAVIAARATATVYRDGVANGYAKYTTGKVLSYTAPLVLYAVGGILLVATPVWAVGFVLVGVGTIVAIATTVTFSWVALVEILR